MSGSKSIDWLSGDTRAFGNVTAADDLLHGAQGIAHHALAETWWFEAVVPEHDLTACFYIAVRPNLQMCSSGVWIWRGFKRTQFHADHLNVHAFAPYPTFEGNSISVPAVGLRFDIVKPLEAATVTYQSPDSDTRANLTVTALAPPVGRPDSKHFDQIVRIKGELVVEGERLTVDSPALRDRSWGKARPENPVLSPPVAFSYGIFDGGKTALCFTAFDDPVRGAEWAGVYKAPQLLLDGWIMRDGQLERIVKLSKQTTRDPTDRMCPLASDVHFEDSTGRHYQLRGRARNGYGMHHWPSMYLWLGLTDWELDGQKGQGEMQDIAWPDYCKRYWS